MIIPLSIFYYQFHKQIYSVSDCGKSHWSIFEELSSLDSTQVYEIGKRSFVRIFLLLSFCNYSLQQLQWRHRIVLFMVFCFESQLGKLRACLKTIMAQNLVIFYFFGVPGVILVVLFAHGSLMLIIPQAVASFLFIGRVFGVPVGNRPTLSISFAIKLCFPFPFERRNVIFCLWLSSPSPLELNLFPKLIFLSTPTREGKVILWYESSDITVPFEMSSASVGGGGSLPEEGDMEQGATFHACFYYSIKNWG